jgi:hypothetical protein
MGTLHLNGVRQVVDAAMIALRVEVFTSIRELEVGIMTAQVDGERSMMATSTGTRWAS